MNNFHRTHIKGNGGIFFVVVNANVIYFSRDGRTFRYSYLPTKSALMPCNTGVF